MQPSEITQEVADRLDEFLSREREADPVEAGALLGRLESPLERFLSRLVAEQYGIEETFDGFHTPPGADTGRSITEDGMLQLTGAAYVLGPPDSLWPFHARLARHPRQSVLCLSDRRWIVAQTRGKRMRVPPDPLSWPYVMTTLLPRAAGLP